MIELITDSTCDLDRSRAEELGLTVLPLTVHFGDEAFRDGIDLSHEEFYARLAEGKTLPTTSQVNPDAFVRVFEAARERGNQAVCILLSRELSGTFQSACIAREMVGGEGIYLVDSRTVTFPLGLLVTKAAQLRDEGLSAAELSARVEELAGRVRLLAAVDTLKYLKLGGRISAATAVVGGMLGVTPLVGIVDGRVESVGKCRGRKAAFRWIREQMTAQDLDLEQGVAFGHSNSPEAMEECMAALREVTAGAKITLRSGIGSVVGTHAGPGAAGVAYFVKHG